MTAEVIPVIIRRPALPTRRDTMSVRLSLDVSVPMRDGIDLKADIWLPDSDIPVPVLLMRTPYGKGMIQGYGDPAPGVFELLRRGYAVVAQECRGTFGSEGEFTVHADETSDGADTIRWLARQDWCNGSVGMFGASYLGFTQFYAAASGVPELKAIAPTISSPDVYRAPWYSPGGAMSLRTVAEWGLMMGLQSCERAVRAGVGDPADLMSIVDNLDHLDEILACEPIADIRMLEKHMPTFVQEIVRRPTRDSEWTKLSVAESFESVLTPALHIGGWFDLFRRETVRAFTEMKDHAGTEAARTGQRLIMGPWGHSQYTGVFPDRKFGILAGMNAAQLGDSIIAFFDRWLDDDVDRLEDVPPVKIFVMGIDQWRTESDWPLPDTRYVPYFLDGDGPANSAAGHGTLTATEPTDDAIDVYRYDPRNPVPDIGGDGLQLSQGVERGPADQSGLHDRDDILIFSTPPLEHGVEVTGPLTAVLYVSSSALDTDFTVKLVDVLPDGRALCLSDGILRMRYRESLAEPTLLTPGEIYEVEVEMAPTSNVFLPGHRLLVEISSSNFPRYDRNTNTGGEIANESLAEMVVATNRVFRGREYPSRIVLPIIDRH